MATSFTQTLAQTLAPVDVPLIERRHLNFSGVAWEGDATTWDMSGAGAYLGDLGTVSTPYAYWLESVTFTSNRMVRGRVIWGFQDTIDGSGSPPLTQGQFVIPPGGSVTVPAGILLRGSLEGAGQVRITAYMDENYGGDEGNPPYYTTGPVTVTAFASGYAFADDLNFAADKPLLFIGDSLWNGTGATAKDDFIPWRIRNYYADKGESVRMVLGGQSGTTTQAHDAFIANGRYDLPKLGGIFYQLGTNNAAQALNVSVATADIARAIAWKKARYPNTPMVIFGPPPAENNTVETALALIRTAFANAVTAAADPLIKFKSLAGAFDRTAGTAVYVSSDSAGSRLHPNPAGMEAEWDGGYSGFTGIEAFLDAELPTLS